MMVQKKIIWLFAFVTFLCSMQLHAATTQLHSHAALPKPHPHSYAGKHPRHVRHARHKVRHHTIHKHAARLHLKSPQQHPLEVAAVSPGVTAATPPPSLMSTLGEHMVQFVHSTISTLRYTAYKLGGTHFDSSNGIYIVDCSDYVDHLLQVANPSAYLSLVNSSGSGKPTSEHYYHFFTGLTYKPRHYWNKVENVNQLQPGDILVFRNKKNSHTGVSGHVMVVMNKPTRTQNAFLVRVTDSASSGHSQDTRLPHTSGIGIGTMQIKVNPDTGQPSAYAWKLGSPFEKHVNFAMARPIGH